MKTLLQKRLVPLALSLALLAGLLAIPAAAAPAAPTEELADITYYGGSYTNCKMACTNSSTPTPPRTAGWPRTTPVLPPARAS